MDLRRKSHIWCCFSLGVTWSIFRGLNVLLLLLGAGLTTMGILLHIFHVMNAGMDSVSLLALVGGTLVAQGIVLTIGAVLSLVFAGTKRDCKLNTIIAVSTLILLGHIGVALALRYFLHLMVSQTSSSSDCGAGCQMFKASILGFLIPGIVISSVVSVLMAVQLSMLLVIQNNNKKTVVLEKKIIQTISTERRRSSRTSDFDLPVRCPSTVSGTSKSRFLTTSTPINIDDDQRSRGYLSTVSESNNKMTRERKVSSVPGALEPSGRLAPIVHTPAGHVSITSTLSSVSMHFPKKTPTKKDSSQITSSVKQVPLSSSSQIREDPPSEATLPRSYRTPCADRFTFLETDGKFNCLDKSLSVGLSVPRQLLHEQVKKRSSSCRSRLEDVSYTRRPKSSYQETPEKHSVEGRALSIEQSSFKSTFRKCGSVDSNSEEIGSCQEEMMNLIYTISSAKQYPSVSTSRVDVNLDSTNSGSFKAKNRSSQSKM